MTSTQPAPPMVTLRYWAAAKEAAGTSEEQVPGASLDGALQAARQRHGARFSAVLEVASLLVDGRRVTPGQEHDLPPGAVVEVLPPFAGG